MYRPGARVAFLDQDADVGSEIRIASTFDFNEDLSDSFMKFPFIFRREEAFGGSDIHEWHLVIPFDKSGPTTQMVLGRPKVFIGENLHSATAECVLRRRALTPHSALSRGQLCW
jgi:hypothetical protein